MTILLDTGVIIATFNRGDRYHRWAARQVKHILKGMWGPPYVTDYIIDEALSPTPPRGRDKRPD